LQSDKLPWLDRNYGRQQAMRTAVQKLGLAEPAEALAVAAGFQRESGVSEYGSAIRPVLMEWCQRDPAAAKRWIAEHGDEGSGTAGVAGAVAVFAADPAEGVRLLKEALLRRGELQGDGKMEMGQWRELARNLTDGNADAALAHARSLPKDDPLRTGILQAMAAETRWKPSTPESLALLAEGVSASPVTPDRFYDNWRLEHAVANVMQDLAAADPQTALQKAREFPDAPRATAAVLNWVMQNNTEAAPALLREALSSPETTAAIAKVLADDGHSLTGHPTDYSALLAKVPEARVLIAGPLLTNWVVANPAAASGFVAEELQAGRKPAGGQQMVVQWVLNDSSAAAAWVESLPRGDFRNAAELNVVNNWRRTNPEAAKAWQERITPVR
jgi:hypothetical protein